MAVLFCTNRTWEKKFMTFHELYQNPHKLNLSPFFHCSDACKKSIETVVKLLSRARDHLSDENRFLQINWNYDNELYFLKFASSETFCSSSSNEHFVQTFSCSFMRNLFQFIVEIFLQSQFWMAFEERRENILSTKTLSFQNWWFLTIHKWRSLFHNLLLLHSTPIAVSINKWHKTFRK